MSNTTHVAQFNKQPLTDLVSSIDIQIRGSSQYDKFKRLYHNDRIAFVYDIMPTVAQTITNYQVEILGLFDSGKTRVAVRGPHGLGKTFLAAIMVHHSVLTAQSDCKVPTTASAYRQLDKYLWPEIRKMALGTVQGAHSNAAMGAYGGGRMVGSGSLFSSGGLAWPLIGRSPYDRRTELLSTKISLNSGTVEAFAVASDNYALIEGAHATRLVYVFDEAKTIETGMWNAAEGAFSTEGLSQDHEALALAISTPGPPTGRFYDIHMRKPGYEDWTVRHVTLDEAIRAGRISRKWAEQRKLQWGEESSVYQNRVLGEFADNSEEGIIPLSWVRAANERWEQWDKNGRPDPVGSRTMGVDVARLGADETVFAFRHGLVLSNVRAFKKTTATRAAALLSQYADSRTINIEVDGGLGAAVYDICKSDNVPFLRPITVGGKSWNRDRSGELMFFNVRTAMWWNLREMLDPIHGDGIALPPHEKLTADLVTPTWEIKRGAIIHMESKKNLMKRLGRSPDYGTAVALAFWKSSSGGGIVF